MQANALEMAFHGYPLFWLNPLKDQFLRICRQHLSPGISNRGVKEAEMSQKWDIQAYKNYVQDRI